ncbi:MAG: hypothetical protein ACI39Q_08465, partial [Wujia sp.]
MERIHNRKNKLYKLTSLCLTLVLLMTPLFSYAGGKGDAMADNPGQTFTMEISAQAAGNAVTAESDSEGNTVRYNMEANVALTDTWYVAGQNKIELMPVAAVEADSELVWKEENIAYTGLDVCYLVVSEPEALEENVMTADALTSGKTRTLNDGDVVGIYVKPTGITASGAVTEEDIAKLSYSCVAAYKICKADSSMLPDIAWKNGDGTVVSSKYAKGAIALSSADQTVTSIKVVTADDQLDTYKLRYGCVFTEDMDEELLPDDVAAWKTTAGLVKASSLASNAANRKYVAYVTFVDDSGVDPVCLSDVTKTAQIYQTGDVTKPSLSGITLELQHYSGSGWQPVTDYTGTGSYFADADKTYRFVVTVPETADGSGVGVDKDKVTIMMDAEYPAVYDSVSGKYYTGSITMPDTFVFVNLGVSDLAGNEADKSFGRVIGVNSDLVVNKCVITSDPEGEVPVDLSEGYYTNKKYYLSIEASSGYPFESIKATRKQDGSTKELWKADDLSSIVRDADTYLFTYREVVELPLDNDPGLNADGEGNVLLDTIHVYISDTNGQKYDTTKAPLSTLGGFLYDNISPEVGDVTLQDDSSGTWKDVDSKEISETDGSVSIDVTDPTKYRYSFTAKDEDGSGINLSRIKCYTDKACKTEYTNAVIAQGEDADTYTCEINKDDVADAGRLTLWIRVYDNAGNKTVYALSPILCEANMDFEFEDIYLLDAAGNKIVWSKAWNINTNKAYTLYVTVSSGYKIDEDVIGIRKSKTSGTNYINGQIKSGTNKRDEVTKRYTAVMMFELPNNPKVNESYENMVVYVASVGPGSKVKTKPLGQLIYDNTVPRVKLTETIPQKWLNSYSLKYEIASGSQNEESALAEATYSVLKRDPVKINVAGKSKVSGKINIPESTSITGTMIEFNAIDEAGNAMSSKNKFTVYVDKTAPVVQALSIGGKSQMQAPLTGAPTIKATVSDNLTLDRIWMEIQYPDGNVENIEKTYGAEGIRDDISDSISYTLKADKQGNAQDGQYVAIVYAQDKAGNIATKKKLTFEIDNTLPVVSAKIMSGTEGGKMPRKDGTDMYYRSDVGMHFTYKEYNIQSVTITDNGSPVTISWDGRKGDAVFSGEGRHIVTISAVDKAGNRSVDKTVEFVIDKSAPILSLALNGLAYAESRGVVDVSGDATVSVAVSDLTEDINDFYYNVVQTKPDHATTDSTYLKSAARSFTFTEEADYTVNCYAVDMANNQSATRSVSFRIDRTAPELSISGIPASGASADPVTVNCSVKEAFWKDATGTVTIYRKAGDGAGESVYKTIDVKPTAYETSVLEHLTETGEYRIEFEASDRVGHTATTSQNVIIDCDAPEITLSGVNNYDVTDETVKLHSEIRDAFYNSKKVTVEGTRTDIDGKVNKLSFT